MSAKLFVGNLSQITTSDEIRSLFAAIGAVKSWDLIMDRVTGQSKGFGFIEMHSVESAGAAKEKLNGLNLHGQVLKVQDAKPQIRRSDRADSRPH